MPAAFTVKELLAKAKEKEVKARYETNGSYELWLKNLHLARAVLAFITELQPTEPCRVCHETGRLPDGMGPDGPTRAICGGCRGTGQAYVEE